MNLVPVKSVSISKRRSSARVSPLEVPLLVVSTRHEKAPLEIVGDSKEALASSAECRLLKWVSIGMSLVGLMLSPLRSNWLYKIRAAYSLADAVSSLEEESPSEKI